MKKVMMTKKVVKKTPAKVVKSMKASAFFGKDKSGAKEERAEKKSGLKD